MGCQPSHVEAAPRSKSSDRSAANKGAASKPADAPVKKSAAESEAETRKHIAKTLNNLGFGRVYGDSSEQPLTAEQRRIIKDTWTNKLSVDLTELGRKVFLRIFELRPSVKYLFPFRNFEGEQLVRHPMFLEQARRFMLIIASVVEAVDNLSSARFGSPALTQLGRKHVTMEGFIGNYFQVFTQAVVTVCLKELGPSCTTEMADSWKTLFEYIIKQLEDGYNHEKESRAG